jgi:hypothetical protein
MIEAQKFPISGPEKSYSHIKILRELLSTPIVIWLWIHLWEALAALLNESKIGSEFDSSISLWSTWVFSTFLRRGRGGICLYLLRQLQLDEAGQKFPMFPQTLHEKIMTIILDFISVEGGGDGYRPRLLSPYGRKGFLPSFFFLNFT